MSNVAEYIKGSYEELTQKVTWPTMRELQNSAVLVLVAAVIISAVIFGMDQIIGYLIKQFYSSLT
ncbi:preprotein translocase subunit SecE [Mucilaginibacter agri]|uniref:Protein translocase subunit SecE n=1 Tax=Mucilaginibacter agri TaxID=2695265 RepID=A0A966DQV1_9SPHI|nr:preprotein translocase subunit SecE [Mucilaginibacter agri]NCD68378.1 preprotein translocase subunit SecE [Mucilaginibacter agri]